MSTGNKALVTGSTGFVGANLVRRLINEGYEVHILTRKNSDTWRIKDILPQLTNHTGDLTNFERLKKIAEDVNPELILHLATASVFGGKHLPDKNVIAANFSGTLNMINACTNVDYKCFINTGSSSEYGPKNMPMKEEDICEPVDIYGITKLASTLYGKVAAQQNDKPIVTLRLFSPFGPYDDPSRLMTYAVLNALDGKDLKLANPGAVRDYIYIRDVIEAYINAINQAHKIKGKIFNVGTGKETQISYAVEKIIEFTNSKSKVFWNATTPRLYDTPHWEADMDKSRNMLKLNIKTSFEEGLKETIEWFKENKYLYN